MDYKQAVSEYFEKKGKRFIKQYPDFESLNSDHTESLRQWKDDMQNKGIYHWHANLSTAYKAIKRKLKKGGELWPGKD